MAYMILGLFLFVDVCVCTEKEIVEFTQKAWTSFQRRAKARADCISAKLKNLISEKNEKLVMDGRCTLENATAEAMLGSIGGGGGTRTGESRPLPFHPTSPDPCQDREAPLSARALPSRHAAGLP